MTKISIIGAGKVGSACGFLLLAKRLPTELILIDKNKELAQGEALDLGHASVSLSPNARIIGTDNIAEIRGSKIIIITAGKARTTEASRVELASANKKIVESLCSDAIKLAPEATFLIVTNPATQMAEAAKKICSKVIAMDNQLDTARFKYYLASSGKPVTELKSKVFGEHGENMQFDVKDDVSEEVLEKARSETIRAGKHIVSLKGFTCWGIASQVAEEVSRLLKRA